MLEIGDAVMLGNRPRREAYDLVFEEARNGESSCGRSSRSPACVACREDMGYDDVEYDPRGREDGTGGCSQGMLRRIRVQNTESGVRRMGSCCACALVCLLWPREEKKHTGLLIVVCLLDGQW